VVRRVAIAVSIIFANVDGIVTGRNSSSIDVVKGD
jgi:hypothetical protein